MRQVNELVDSLTRQEGITVIPGWWYDVVLERLERMGYERLPEAPSDIKTWMEGSVYQKESSRLEVVTSRLEAPATVIKSVISSKKPPERG